MSRSTAIDSLWDLARIVAAAVLIRWIAARFIAEPPSVWLLAPLVGFFWLVSWVAICVIDELRGAAQPRR